MKMGELLSGSSGGVVMSQAQGCSAARDWGILTADNAISRSRQQMGGNLRFGPKSRTH